MVTVIRSHLRPGPLALPIRVVAKIAGALPLPHLQHESGAA